MSLEDGKTHVLNMFDATASSSVLVEDFTDDIDAVRQESRAHLVSMLDNLAYVDNVKHPMASSLHSCALLLAVYMSLRERGVDVHAYGNKVLEVTAARAEAQSPPALSNPAPALAEAAELPVKDGEFAFDVYDDEGDRYGLNIKSCAVCGLFSQYDAMELVPYMCASDDVVSDARGQGLERTGTIALGAHQCDFVFDKSGAGKKLVDQYPDKIRLIE